MEKLEEAPATIINQSDSLNGQSKENQSDQQPEKMDNDIPKADTEAVTVKDEKVSKRVQEAMDYNKRSRERSQQKPYQKKDWSKNVKSVLTAQEESSDPVEIRKQVVLPID